MKKTENRMKISITGKSGVGKTTVAFIIAKALAEAGLDIDSFNSDIPQVLMVDDVSQDARLIAIRDIQGVKIDLVEVNVRPYEVFLDPFERG